MDYALALALVFALFIFGFGLIMFEIFVFPGINVAGIVGAMMVLAGIYFSYQVQPLIGHLSLLGAITFTSLILYKFLKPKTWEKVSLKNEIKGQANHLEKEIEVGDLGVTISKLSPMGSAFIKNKVVEVHAMDILIENNVEIKVAKIEDNKIFVKTIE